MSSSVNSPTISLFGFVQESDPLVVCPPDCLGLMRCDAMQCSAVNPKLFKKQETDSASADNNELNVPSFQGLFLIVLLIVHKKVDSFSRLSVE